MLRRYSVNQVIPFTLLVPVFGVLSGVLMLGETLNVQSTLGGIATIAGVAVIVLRRPHVTGLAMTADHNPFPPVWRLTRRVRMSVESRSLGRAWRRQDRQ